MPGFLDSNMMTSIANAPGIGGVIAWLDNKTQEGWGQVVDFVGGSIETIGTKLASAKEAVMDAPSNVTGFFKGQSEPAVEVAKSVDGQGQEQIVQREPGDGTVFGAKTASIDAALANHGVTQAPATVTVAAVNNSHSVDMHDFGQFAAPTAVSAAVRQQQSIGLA